MLASVQIFFFGLSLNVGKCSDIYIYIFFFGLSHLGSVKYLLMS